MLKINKLACMLLITTLLTACGGGSHSSSATTTYPLQQAYLTYLHTTNSQTFTIGGIVDNAAITGSGTLTTTALTAGTFNGPNGAQSAQQQIMSVAGTATSDNTTLPFSAINSFYYDANNLFLGATGVDSLAATSATLLPTTVKMGDAGVLYTANIYEDDTFTTLIGSSKVTFTIDPDISSKNALFTLTTTEFDITGAVSDTTIETFQLTSAGVLSRKSIVSRSDGDEVRYTF